jgi:hypothetical protein
LPSSAEPICGATLRCCPAIASAASAPVSGWSTVNLTAVAAGDDVLAAPPRGAHLPGRGEQATAAAAGQVVDVPDLVRVQHQQRHRPAAAARQLVVQRLLQTAAVAQAGERIADRLQAQRFAQAQVTQRPRPLFGRRFGDGDARQGGEPKPA